MPASGTFRLTTTDDRTLIHREGANAGQVVDNQIFRICACDGVLTKRAKCFSPSASSTCQRRKSTNPIPNSSSTKLSCRKWSRNVARVPRRQRVCVQSHNFAACLPERGFGLSSRRASSYPEGEGQRIHTADGNHPPMTLDAKNTTRRKSN